MDIHPEKPEQLRFVLAPSPTLASSTLLQVSSAQSRDSVVRFYFYTGILEDSAQDGKQVKSLDASDRRMRGGVTWRCVRRAASWSSSWLGGSQSTEERR